MDIVGNKFKYLLIFDRNASLIYGECIEWKVGTFDKKDDIDIKITLPYKYIARVISTSSRIDIIDTEKKSIFFMDIGTFTYDDSGDDFITLSASETLFNPLIDRCSKTSIYMKQDRVEFENDDWMQENKKLLDDIKAKFDIDFHKRPELINTYSFYEPTRISVDTFFTDKPTYGEKKEPTNLKVIFIIEHQCYKNLHYEVTEYVDGTVIFNQKGNVTNGECLIDSGVTPDEVEIIIYDECD
ncbi:hypothetical protein D3981_005506, partial [Escherichia coli]|nr:hypothetical protein [Escherichia coli]